MEELDALSGRIDQLWEVVAELQKEVNAKEFVRLEALADLIDGDGHVFGTRPCQTCRTATSLIGKPFGCIKRAQQRQTRKAAIHE